MKNLFLILILLGAGGARAEESIADCAAYFEEMRTASFEIDEMTSRDLELDAVLLPALKKTLRTSIGAERLRHLVHHPSLDRDTIVDRQRAIQILADNTLWRRQLRGSLGVIERELGGGFEEIMERLRRHQDQSKKWLEYGLPALGAGGWTACGLLGMSPGVGEPISAVMIGLVTLVAGIPTMDLQERTRAPLHPLRQIFREASEQATGLEQANCETLRRVGDAFAGLTDPGRRLRLDQAYRRLRKSSGDLRLAIASLAHLPLHGGKAARTSLLQNQNDIRALMSMIGELDVLMGIAELYDQNRGQLVFPKILPEDHPTQVRIVEGHHPDVWLERRDESVPNDLEIAEVGRSPRFLLLTGPNTGGKSTYVKMIGLNVLLAQLGFPVAAKAMNLTPAALLTNVRVGDRLEKGQSYFEAQSLRMADIMARAKSQRHALVLMDEILNGTSPEEHRAIERALIEWFVRRRHVALLATHDRALQELEVKVPGVVNIHVDEMVSKSFRVFLGPSKSRNAIEVLRAAGVDAEVCDAAQSYLEEEKGEGPRVTAAGGETRAPLN